MILTSAGTPSPSADVIVNRYEALRVGALGAPLAPAARVGLAVLLGRGMWAWARAAADPPPCNQAARGVTAASVAATPSHRLAGLLAELALAHSGRNL